MKQIKIILFQGGFAGDLFTALHNMDCCIDLLPNGKIELNANVRVLQQDNRSFFMSILEKDEYYNKHDIISCCDSEFALKHHKNTLVIKCDDKIMSSFFCKRLFTYHPELITSMTVEQYEKDVAEWHNFWPKRFKNQLDISDIFSNENFLDKLDIPLDEEKKTLICQWKVINKRIFATHKETYDQ